MTVPPRFSPHPDDEPTNGASSPDSTPAPNFGSLREPGYPAPDSSPAPDFGSFPPSAESSPPRAMPREEPLPPRASGAQNHFGSYGLALSGLSILLSALLFVGVGVIWLPTVVALPGIYYALRGLSAARDGFATNRAMSITALILGIVGVVIVPLYFAVLAALLVAVIDGLS